MPRLLRRVILSLAVAFVLLLVLAPSAVRYVEARNRPAEAAQLAAGLGVRPGMTVGEIGAGAGRMAIEMARIVGPTGRVIATEIGEDKLRAIARAAVRANQPNVTVLPAGEHESNLPDACCDAVYMQRVYHHLTDPAGVIASARRALVPGGRLGVIDFEPGGIKNLWAPRGVPDRGGHGVPKEALVREMRAFGFALNGPLLEWSDAHFLAIFTPAAAVRQPRPRQARRTVEMLARVYTP